MAFYSVGSGPVSCVRVSEVPVVTCVPLMIGVGLCSGGTLFLLGADRQSVSVSLHSGIRSGMNFQWYPISA